MNNDDVLEYFEEEFKREKAPESLSKENVLLKLEGVEQEKGSDSSFFKTFSIVAAVLAVVFVSAFGLNFLKNEVFVSNDVAENDKVTTTYAENAEVKATTENAEQITEAVPVKTEIKSTVFKNAESDEELKALFTAMISENVRGYYDSALKGNASVTMAATAPALNSFGVVADEEAEYSGSMNSAIGETNLQVLGVDEGDIVKNDGRYLYIIARDGKNNSKLKIVDTETMNYVYNQYLYDENGDILEFSQIYLYGNYLVIMANKRTDTDTYRLADGLYSYAYRAFGDTVSYVYDTTDKSNIVLTKTTVQSGSYVSSRMIGGVLYTVSNYYVPLESEETVENGYKPKINGEFIGCDCIFIEDEKSNTYLCLTANDVTKPEQQAGKIAILGSSGQVYCSTKRLYTISTEYYNLAETENKEVNTYNVNSYTVINAFDLNGTSITHSAEGKVPGMVNDQYWLDENGGYLRVGTNYYSYNSNTNSNGLFILNEKLEPVGELIDIAKGEDIKSIRFMGNKGYIVTFKQVDPLFVFDLSDPTKPKITGELKLPGYSTYLHPISDTLLLGVGYDGTDTNADFETVKVSLFDISDMANPKELDNILFKNQFSDISESGDAKAFMYIESKNLVVIPTEVYDYDGVSEEEFSCNLIEIKDGKLELYADYEHGCDSSFGNTFIRGTYIGENFYCMSDNVVTRFDMLTNQKTGQCTSFKNGQ